MKNSLEGLNRFEITGALVNCRYVDIIQFEKQKEKRMKENE